jgi:DNA-binding NtrC family response regulator
MTNAKIDSYDYQRYSILIVDEEPTIRNYFHRLFCQKFQVLTASSSGQARVLLESATPEVAVVMTRQAKADEEFLGTLADSYPDEVRILSVSYPEIDVIIGMVNHAGTFRYVISPWDVPQLEVTLRRAIEFYTVKRERDALLSAKMQAVG